jgi:hypothetical protein
MPGEPIEELCQLRYRQRGSGIEIGAARVHGWIIWDGDGAHVVSEEDFDATCEPVDQPPLGAG